MPSPDRSPKQSQYATIGVRIKCSEDYDMLNPELSEEVREELERQLLELGKNGFIIKPLFNEGYWTSSSDGVYYRTLIMCELGRQAELQKLGVIVSTWCF